MTTAANIETSVCLGQSFELSEERTFEKRKLVVNIDDGDDEEEPTAQESAPLPLAELAA